MTAIRFALVLLVGLACAPTWADELKTINGKTQSGALEKITPTDVILNVGGKSMNTPLPQVLDLILRAGRSLPAAASYIEVQLIDESLLRCTAVKFGAKEITLELTSGAAVKVPLAALLTVLRDAQDVNLRKQWQSLLKDRKNTDRIFILSGGDLQPLEGAIGAINDADQTFQFKSGGKTIEPKLDKVHGMQFTRVDVPAENSLCRVFDTDGNVLVASKLAYSGGPLDIATPFGHKLALDIKAVSRFDFNFGRLTYLSDLDAKMPDAVLLGGFNPLKKNANLDGNPIILQDKKYEKGLSVYAGTELEYNLGGKYKNFKALLGVDAGIAEEGQGKVIVTIYCDREKRGEYPVSTKAPMPIALNVKDVNTLRIVVSGANFTGFSGHATLANAHVSQ